MAPTRPSTKKARLKARLPKKKSETESRNVRQLYAEATTALTQGDAAGARSSAQRALDAVDGDSAHPQWVALHTLLGEAQLELGDQDQARTHFEAAVEADPDGSLPEDRGGGVEKFLYLAQLSEAGGLDSVRWFERGAAALRTKIAGLEGSANGAAATEAALKRGKLAETLCAIAEVYMTDLSFEPDCEARCEALVTEATLLASDSPDVWQTVASVRVSQDREEDAKAALERSLALWQDLPPEDPSVPDFPVRVSLVRLLMTVGLLEEAADVAERCVREADQSIEVWYLGGYALHLIGGTLKEGGELESWKEHWTSSRTWLRRCLDLYEKHEYEDERLKQHATEILDEIAAELNEGPLDNDEGWEDTDGEPEGEDEDGDEEME